MKEKALVTKNFHGTLKKRVETKSGHRIIGISSLKTSRREK